MHGGDAEHRWKQEGESSSISVRLTRAQLLVPCGLGGVGACRSFAACPSHRTGSLHPVSLGAATVQVSPAPAQAVSSPLPPLAPPQPRTTRAHPVPSPALATLLPSSWAPAPVPPSSVRVWVQNQDMACSLGVKHTQDRRPPRRAGKTPQIMRPCRPRRHAGFGRGTGHNSGPWSPVSAQADRRPLWGCGPLGPDHSPDPSFSCYLCPFPQLHLCTLRVSASL